MEITKNQHRCNNCYPNNDGGLWCWKHTYEIKKGDCEQCENRTTKSVNSVNTVAISHIQARTSTVQSVAIIS